jgi:catechol 2,3-dioxygenase-like lactoylglutathione lyase family enzyme
MPQQAERDAVLSYAYFGTNDLNRAIAFYDAVLATLGMRRCVTGDPEWDRTAAGWGTYEDDGARELAFWIGIPFDGKPASVGNGGMVAFRAHDWGSVDAFHATALANGGRDDGSPGLRLNYGADFYAAYVRDPDGNKLAAVCGGKP